MVKAKKHLGQHFLKDDTVSKGITDALKNPLNCKHVLEVGPGTGALTKFLLVRPEFETSVIEVDKESIEYLKKHYLDLKGRIYEFDFLKADLSSFFNGEPFALVGNFPYHISSQIVFKVIENRDVIPEMSGMFQKEVAWRIACKPGSKDYGILSVLAQAYFKCDYLFSVGPEAFIPPPKINSGVLHLTRIENNTLPVTYQELKTIVKLGFGQRRKTLRNSLKSILPEGFTHELMSQRPEQLSVEQFVELTLLLR
jgi:16S rRNA (adenine1518-N6/adenine1519-N6)-dimethyltransferase